MTNQPGVQPDRIDANDPASAEQWAKKLDVTVSQLRDAVAAVGDKAADIEMHLKGSHSTTNADRTGQLGASCLRHCPGAFRHGHPAARHFVDTSFERLS